MERRGWLEEPCEASAGLRHCGMLHAPRHYHWLSHNVAAPLRGAEARCGKPVVTGRETRRGPFGGKGC